MCNFCVSKLVAGAKLHLQRKESSGRSLQKLSSIQMNSNHYHTEFHQYSTLGGYEAPTAQPLVPTISVFKGSKIKETLYQFCHIKQ